MFQATGEWSNSAQKFCEIAQLWFIKSFIFLLSLSLVLQAFLFQIFINNIPNFESIPVFRHVEDNVEGMYQFFNAHGHKVSMNINFGAYYLKFLMSTHFHNPLG